MKERMKKLTSILMLGVMVFSLTACGGTSEETSEEPAAEETVEAGSTLNIWCWNDEFQSRFNDYYPGVKEVAEDKSTTTLEDGTIVKWTINPNENNNYQNKLDEALLAQADAAADESSVWW